jgi:outer membrane protein TolC
VKKSAALLLIFLATTSVAAAQEGALQLTLKGAIKSALEKNLDLKAELYTPAQFEADVRKNRAIYEPHLTLNTSYHDSRPYSPALHGGYDQSTLNITPGAFQLLPSGGTIDLAYQNAQQKNSTVAPLGSYWTSSLLLSLNQPLLKNFGKETTELNIRVAELSREGSLNRLKSVILATVAQVSSEYYKLGSFRQDLESKKISLELARKIYTDTEARVRAGVIPAMETLNAQYGVSLREKDIIDAEKAVRDQVDILGQLLQLGKVEDIIPIDTPDKSPYTVNEEDAVRRAVANRPELEELQSQLRVAELQTRVTKRQILPSLNFSASAGFAGLDSAYGRNSERLGSLDYPLWSVGLQFDYPLGNESAENDYVKSRLKTEQLRTQLESQISQLTSEVRIAIRSVQSAFKLLDVTDRARLYADERLKAYIRKSEVGLATNKDVLDVENDLAAARTNQIKAQLAYSTALSQLWKSTGELLEKEGITVDDEKSARLYKGAR